MCFADETGGNDLRGQDAATLSTPMVRAGDGPLPSIIGPRRIADQRHADFH